MPPEVPSPKDAAKFVYDPPRSYEKSYPSDHPEALKKPFGFFSPRENHSPSLPTLISATDLVSQFDGTDPSGELGFQVEINEQGDTPQRIREATIAHLSEGRMESLSREPAVIKIPERAEIASLGYLPMPTPDEAVGSWGIQLSGGKYVPYSDASQERMNAIVEQTQQDLGEWKASGSQEDFRTWIGNKRVAQLTAQEGK